MLLDLAARLPHGDLPVDLGVDTPRDVCERVHVLDLAPRPELVRPVGPHRHVGVHAQRSLLHLRVGDAELDDRLPEKLQEPLGLLRGVDVRRGDDLHERRPAAVVVDERVVGTTDPAGPAADVDVLRRILLEVRADDPDLMFTIWQRHYHLAIDARR